MTPEERAKDFYTLPPAARTLAALARVIRQAEEEATKDLREKAWRYDELCK